MPIARELAPVFVVGAPGAGTGLLAWSLAHHPRMEVLLNGGWLGMLSAALGPILQEAARSPDAADSPLLGASLERHLAAFGEAAGACARSELSGRWSSHADDGRLPRRWVTADAENAFQIYGLSRLFPRARFIHVLRELDPVLRHLTEPVTATSSYFTPRSAREAWLRHVNACVRAERALGPEVVLRVRYDRLAANPEDEIRRCLAFLGEPFHDACVRPVKGLGPDPASTGNEGVTGGEHLRSDPVPRWQSSGPEAPALLRREFLSSDLPSGPAGFSRSPVDRLREMVRYGIPEGGTVLVVSRGDEDLVRLPGRTGWHFPQGEGGVYAGHHPGDSSSAITHLEELRERGAGFLLIPCTAFWWIDFYDDFRRHLNDRYRLIAFHEDVCLLFSLRSTPPDEGVSVLERALWRGQPAHPPSRSERSAHGTPLKTQEA